MLQEKTKNSQVKALLESTVHGDAVLETVNFHSEHCAEQLWFLQSCLLQSEDYNEAMMIERQNLTILLGDVSRLLKHLKIMISTE